MKLTIHHVAMDGPNSGTESFVFPTEAALHAWMRSCIEHELEGTSAEQEHVDAIRECLATGEISEAWDIFEEHLKDPLETYAIEQTEIDVPLPLAVGEALDQCDTAFAVLNICDGLMPQARSALRQGWAAVQKALVEDKPDSIYAQAVLGEPNSALNRSRMKK
jgi:hypothetical protein